MRPQYFSRDGRLLSEDEALGPGGYMRDGVICRVALRDGAPRIFDADLHRPGSRSSSGGTSSSFGDYLALDDRRAAYADHQNYLENAWRNPTTKLADATEEGGECFLPSGDDTVGYSARNEHDKRSVAQRMHDHTVRMDSIYESVARDLENSWRKR
jgi:hypothetical protein